jgi:hypothetical protein
MFSQVVSFLTYVREVRVSDLGRNNSYPHLCYPWFSPVPQGKCKDSILFIPRPFPPASFPIQYSPSAVILPVDIMWYGMTKSLDIPWINK